MWRLRNGELPLVKFPRLGVLLMGTNDVDIAAAGVNERSVDMDTIWLVTMVSGVLVCLTCLVGKVHAHGCTASTGELSLRRCERIYTPMRAGLTLL